jgi:hypothetical protein
LRSSGYWLQGPNRHNEWRRRGGRDRAQISGRDRASTSGDGAGRVKTTGSPGCRSRRWRAWLRRMVTAARRNCPWCGSDANSFWGDRLGRELHADSDRDHRKCDIPGKLLARACPPPCNRIAAVRTATRFSISDVAFSAESCGLRIQVSGRKRDAASLGERLSITPRI